MSWRLLALLMMRLPVVGDLELIEWCRGDGLLLGLLVCCPWHESCMLNVLVGEGVGLLVRCGPLLLERLHCTLLRKDNNWWLLGLLGLLGLLELHRWCMVLHVVRRLLVG